MIIGVKCPSIVFLQISLFKKNISINYHNVHVHKYVKQIKKDFRLGHYQVQFFQEATVMEPYFILYEVLLVYICLKLRKSIGMHKIYQSFKPNLARTSCKTARN